MPAAINNTNPDMGARGRSRRVELGMSKQELADLLDVGIKRVSQMEQHGCEGLTAIERWAKALRMDPQELIFGRPEPSRRKRA